MGLLAKILWASFSVLVATAVPGFAQGGEVAFDIGNILFGVSVLLIAVSFMIVMMKVARFMDVLTARMEKDSKK